MTIRSKLREELPLSTRVHELAKELGLKSQELLERIQSWGLEVKVSALASLDTSTVERIRELMRQPSAAKDVPSARTAPPATTPAVRTTPRPVASVPLSPGPSASPSAGAQGGASTARPAGGQGTAPVRPVAAAPGTSPAQPRPVAAVVSPAAVRPSGGAHQAPRVRLRLRSGLAALPSRHRVPLVARDSASPGEHSAREPVANSVELASSVTIRGWPVHIPCWRWPLSAHTPHRGTGLRPGGGPGLAPSAESRPSRPQGSAAAGHQEGAPGSATFQPLKRSDYMSSAGIRPPLQRTGRRRPNLRDRPVAPATTPPPKGGVASLSRALRRPLPPVAAPQRPCSDRGPPPGRRARPAKARRNAPRSI